MRVVTLKSLFLMILMLFVDAVDDVNVNVDVDIDDDVDLIGVVEVVNAVNMVNANVVGL